jgi:uncharacterized membrane protein YccF (DUF307 family)
MIRLILNLLWFVFGGFLAGLGWVLAGCILAITIIGLPWVPSAFRIAGFSFWPFGRVVVERPDAGAGSVVLNILWLIFAGWWLALGHLTIAFGLAITLIGIPFAWQHVKLAILSLTPVGRDVVERA